MKRISQLAAPFVRCALGMAAFALSACGGAQTFAPGGAAPAARPASGSGSGYISHIVLIVQENRSFDNLFATFPGADGATTGKWKNQNLKLRKVGLASCDFPHTRSAFLKDYASGKMNGFGTEASRCGYGAKGDPYQYVNPRDIAPYWDMASQYVLADHMFQTQGSGSFTAHQDLIGGGTSIDRRRPRALVDFPSRAPWGCDAPARHRHLAARLYRQRPHVRIAQGAVPVHTTFRTRVPRTRRCAICSTRSPSRGNITRRRSPGTTRARSGTPST